MLDINFIRNNQALVEKSVHEKGYSSDISAILTMNGKRYSSKSKLYVANVMKFRIR